MLEWLPAIASAVGKGMDFMNAKSASNKARDAARGAFGARIKDAQKYGIHPLAALGANVSAGPQVAAFSDFGSMGQDIGRAMAAGSSVDDRVNQLTLRNMELRNQLLEGQIAKLNKSQIGPAVPYNTSTMQPIIAGQGDIVSAGSGWDEYPAVAMINPPASEGEAAKHFGYTLVPDLRRFSPPGRTQNILGDEGIGQFIHTSGNYMDMLWRAFRDYHNPRFEARRRRWHEGR